MRAGVQTWATQNENILAAVGTYFRKRCKTCITSHIPHGDNNSPLFFAALRSLDLQLTAVGCSIRANPVVVQSVSRLGLAPLFLPARLIYTAVLVVKDRLPRSPSGDREFYASRQGNTRTQEAATYACCTSARRVTLVETVNVDMGRLARFWRRLQS